MATLLIGCSPERAGPGADGTWVGTITTVGDVTTVVNRSGSVWGGTATLVEEASIGVPSGPEAYMLGRVSGVAADEERIYLLDRQVPALRVYDIDGAHLFDIDRVGQGPGEFQSPDGFALAPDGGIYVTDFSLGRIVAYEPDGTERYTLTVSGLYQRRPYRVDEDGVVFVVVRGDIVGVAPDGSIGAAVPRPSFDLSAWTVRTAPTEGFSAASFRVPFAPSGMWTLTPTGALASALTSEYRITLERPGGGTLVIERAAALVPVEPEEREWHERLFRAQLGAGWGPVVGPIPPTPDFKPAMSRLLAGQDDTLWVVRPGPGERLADCAASATELGPMRERPCWRDPMIVDAFGPDGRYLGEVALPDGFLPNPPPVIEGGRVVAVVEDAAGTIMVKRYRVVPPDDPSPEARLFSGFIGGDLTYGWQRAHGDHVYTYVTDPTGELAIARYRLVEPFE